MLPSQPTNSAERMGRPRFSPEGAGRRPVGSVPFWCGIEESFRRVSGEFLDKVALIVYVPEKKPPEQVPSSQLVPTEFEGFRTDVVEVQMDMLMADDKRYVPLRGGVEIGNYQLTSTGMVLGGGRGTLGCIAHRRQNGKKVFLTWEHVVSSWINDVNQHDALNKIMYQPSLHSNNNPTEIGKCVDASVSFDSAIIEPTSSRGISYTIVGVDITLGYPWTHNPFANPGDSGSAVANDKEEVVGILNAGNNLDPTGNSAFAVPKSKFEYQPIF